MFDKKSNSKNTLKNIWAEYNQYVTANDMEKKLITKTLNHPNDNASPLKNLMDHRHNTFAHNIKMHWELSPETVAGLAFGVRVWSLLNALLSKYPIFMGPFMEFCSVRGSLKDLLTRDELQVFGAQWDQCRQIGYVWAETATTEMTSDNIFYIPEKL